MSEWSAVNATRVLSRKIAFRLLPARLKLDRVS
jgi:hypothetical protein